MLNIGNTVWRISLNSVLSFTANMSKIRVQLATDFRTIESVGMVFVIQPKLIIKTIKYMNAVGFLKKTRTNAN